jgi:ABC-type phosphate transport system substrate-binding protein
MKAFILACFAFAVMAWSPAVPRAQGKPEKVDKLVAVVHADNKITKVAKSSVKAMFLGQTTFWANDVRVKPYNRTHTGAAGKLFFKNILGMAPSRYRHHWQKLQLSGQGVEPDVVGTAAALVGKVAASPGAIGYMLESEASAIDSRVKLVPIE